MFWNHERLAYSISRGRGEINAQSRIVTHHYEKLRGYTTEIILEARDKSKESNKRV